MFTLQAGKQHGIVAALTANGVGTCGADGNQGQAGHLVARTLRAEGFDASEDGTGRGTPLVPVAYRTSGNSGVMEQGDKTAALNTATDPAQQIIGDGMAVRRLMPIECERLQGFPDGWTQFGEHGEEIADGPRYRMLGNAIAVPVAEWIGKRIVAANSKRR
jgi:DNA (cytosine-5)-methyltransferase 1